MLRYTLGPVTIDAVALPELLETVLGAAERREFLSVAYLNAHGFELVHRDAQYAQVLSQFDLIFCDGFGALLACRWLGAPIPQRMTPPDFVEELAGNLHRRGTTVYLLGDEPGVAELMRAKLEGLFPGAVAGTHHGFFDATDEPAIAQRIRDSEASVVLVGMGMPRQEQLIQRFRTELPQQVLFAVGGLFRWYAGIERRGPRWLTDHGFEWLCRLAVQPRKVAGRYLFGLPRLGLRVLRMRVRGQRFTRSTELSRAAED